MLRWFVIILGGLMLAGAGLADVMGAGPQGIGPGIAGGLLLIGTLFEQRGYRQAGEAPLDGDWQPMPERFRDPSTGKVVGVWFNPATGQRNYVRVDGAAVMRDLGLERR